MLCDRCHQREATVHYTQIINGRKTEEHLCQACAGKAKGIDMAGGFGRMGSFMDSMFGGSLFQDLWNQPMGRIRDLTCPTCRTTLDTFQKEGKLGCPDCYDTFRDSLRPFFRKTQAGASHVGKKPGEAVPEEKNDPEIMAMKEKLQKLITEENYEEAAKVRDEIKKKEGDGHGNA